MVCVCVKPNVFMSHLPSFCVCFPSLFLKNEMIKGEKKQKKLEFKKKKKCVARPNMTNIKCMTHFSLTCLSISDGLRKCSHTYY